MYYSFEESFYEGKPVLELLEDGKPMFEETDGRIKRLIFGIKKAKMFICCLDQIKAFCESEGGKPPINSTILIEDKENNLKCYCERRNHFINRYGKEINRPYLRIQSGKTRISFGLKKAKGILFLSDQIEDFIEEYSQ